MKEEHKTKEQLINELAELRQRVAELEAADTDRKRAKEALRALSSRHEAILAAVPDIIMEVDGSKVYTWVNQAGFEFFGEDVLGKEATFYFEGEQETYDTVQPLFNGDENVIYVESWQRRQDGEKRLLAWWCRVLKDANGNVTGALSTARDITERKRVEEALRESEKRFRLAITDAPVPIMIHAEDGEVLQISNVWTELTGFAHSDIPTIADWTLKAYGQRMEDTRSIIDVVFERNAVAHDGEFTIKTKSGETRVWDFSSGPLGQLPDGRRLVISMAVDITERKRAEEKIKAKSLFLESLIQQSPLPTFVMDSKGFVVIVNEAFLKFYAVPNKEMVLGMNTLTEPANVRHGVIKYFREALSGKIVEIPEIEFVSPYENKKVVTRGRLFPILDPTGTLTNVVVIQEDITERVRAEEALKEYSERLEEMVEERTRELRDAQEQLVRREKLAVLGQLAGGVGHELRSPLGVISNAVYYLKMVLSDADETTKEYLGMISAEVRNSTKIISDLLDFSRTRMPDREEIAVSELVAEVLEKRPPPEEVEAITQIAPDLPPVFVDPRQMGQVLVNLVVNAYQAMPEGGALTISAQAEKGQVSISVTDSGCGIPPKNMAKLFEPLFTTKARGIGLGLAVSRSLVEANGGSMEVESEEGKGSTFTVILPTREVVA